jgi:uncharacterized protein (TIGR02246 family)
MTHVRYWASGAVFLAAIGFYVLAQNPPKEPKTLPEANPANNRGGELAPLKEAFRAAFEARDAEAMAKLWTRDAEMITTTGETFRGVAAIEEQYKALFAKKLDVKITLESGEVRSLGPTAMIVDGVLKISLPNDPEGDVTIFQAWVVKEESGWKFARVESHEVDDPPAWLLGDWTGTTADKQTMQLSFSWMPGEKFLQCDMSAVKDGKIVNLGKQILGVDGQGDLHGWLFEPDGGLAESTWAFDGKTWTISQTMTRPDGTEFESSHLLVRLGADAFTAQSLDGEEAPVQFIRQTKK